MDFYSFYEEMIYTSAMENRLKEYREYYKDRAEHQNVTGNGYGEYNEDDDSYIIKYYHPDLNDDVKEEGKFDNILKEQVVTQNIEIKKRISDETNLLKHISKIERLLCDLKQTNIEEKEKEILIWGLEILHQDYASYKSNNRDKNVKPLKSFGFKSEFQTKENELLDVIESLNSVEINLLNSRESTEKQLWELLKSTDFRTEEEERIILGCDNKKFGYFIRCLEPFFNNLTHTTVGRSEKFIGKSGQLLTDERLRKSYKGGPSNPKIRLFIEDQVKKLKKT